MLRLFLTVVVALLMALPATAQHREELRAAMSSIRAKDWEGAARAVRNTDQVARDIVEWHRLRAGEGSPDQVLAFLDRRGDWPGLPYLRKQSEAAFEGVSREIAMSFFVHGNAQTAEGALAQAHMLEQAGEAGAAQAGIVVAWRTMAMNAQTKADYLKRYGDLLAPHHTARLDSMLWKNWQSNSEAMYPHVSDGWVALAKARLGLRAMAKGVDGLINAVPESLQNDPGLAHERFVWRHRKDRDESAIELILARSEAGTLGEPEEWAPRRRSLIRSQMRAGNYRTAYALAATHRLTPEAGYAYADCEWLAGYLALRYLDRPEEAAAHFLRFAQAVETPISLGRAGYWMGRAYEALGDMATAQQAYVAGGAHQTSFYGLLAAEKAGIAYDQALKGTERFPDWREAAWTTSSVHQAARMLLAAGELDLAERFWVHLSETQDRRALGQMGQMALDLGQPHVAVMLGKQMVRMGVTLPGPYYPLHPLSEQSLPVAEELSLAIARRESEFDPVVVSHAGARGLMQLMPGTAQLMSKSTGEAYVLGNLTADPAYNARLGSAYLARLSEQFDGNIIMIAAGYNAGPNRPVRWMENNGDPRDGSTEAMIDWIEMIPFNETRNYVMRVAESLPVYRARLGKDPHPVPFGREIVGATIQRLN
ncbi:lytic transglycosylase domain-containing protein [Shimia sp. MMG029]|uniref:lytic transglycosylase domain-containing protein n=1 Tax=Shimia sp. MMG029 TaxID=3021978 RepID=UPI0022FEC916|nr:lytic transglycosylase domain-containing protein [Shimia sp. MMG029]MDA5556843.1 lytic transglycosylase domain-containing protein [Shimia sp. MMG029]